MIKHFFVTKAAVLSSAALVVGIGIALMPKPVEKPSAKQFKDRLAASTVVVYKGDGYGSGVVISSNTVLTAMHVCMGTPVKAIVDINKKSHPFTKFIYDESPKTDICLIRGDFSALPRLDLADLDVEIGDVVTFAGFPQQGFSIKQGTIQGSETLVFPLPNKAAYKQIEVAKITAGCRPGNSGGPVVNGSMNVVGIVTAFDEYGSACLMTPVSVIKQFIAAASTAGF